MWARWLDGVPLHMPRSAPIGVRGDASSWTPRRGAGRETHTETTVAEIVSTSLPTGNHSILTSSLESGVMVHNKTPTKVMSNAESLNSTLEQQGFSKKSKFRYLSARSENFEKQLAELLQSLSSYARRTAKVRDSGDTTAEVINSMADAEVLNPSLKQSLTVLAKSFRTIQDHRDSEILYLEDKLLPSIAELGGKIQKQRDELRYQSSRVLDGRDKGLVWIKSAPSGSTGSTSRQRRSQSMERLDRPGKEEKMLQQSIQRYELRRNLIFKKLLLKFILSELRFTIRSFNNLTHTYKYILQELNPTDDLRLFNEFFSFGPIRKSTLSEAEDGISEFESQSEPDDDNQDDDSSDENVSPRDTDQISSDEDEEDKEVGESGGESKRSIESTLKRFNSSPEIPINLSANTDDAKTIEQKLNNKSSKSEPKKNLIISAKQIRNKFNSSKKSSIVTNKKGKSKKRVDEEEEDEEEDDNEEDESNSDQEEEEEKVVVSSRASRSKATRRK